MVDRHHTLLVEKGAGIGSGFDDAAYTAAGSGSLLVNSQDKESGGLDKPFTRAERWTTGMFFSMAAIALLSCIRQPEQVVVIRSG